MKAQNTWPKWLERRRLPLLVLATLAAAVAATVVLLSDTGVKGILYRGF